MIRCARKGCEVEFAPRRGGKPQAYCCPECRNLASQARCKARDPERYLARQAEYSKRYRDSLKEMDRKAKERRILARD